MVREKGFVNESVREEIAKRIGISTQYSDRCNQFTKIIPPVLRMVRDEPETIMKSMKAAVEAVVSEMHAIGESYGRQELFRELLKDMDKSVRRYKKEKSSR